MKISELKPGMIITGYGFIIKLNDNKDFYLEEPHMSYVDYNDASNGICWCRLYPEKDYELYAGPDSMIYKSVIHDMVREIMEQQAELGSLASTLCSYIQLNGHKMTEKEEDAFIARGK